MVTRRAVTPADMVALRKMRFCILGLLAFALIASPPISSQVVAKTSIAKQLSRIRPAIVQIAICRPIEGIIKTDVDPFYKSGTRIIGTGLLLDDAGDVLTPAHVAARVQQELRYLRRLGVEADLNIGINPENADPIGASSRATIYVPGSFRKQNSEYDLALLHLDLPGPANKALHKPVPIIFLASPPQEGDEVLAVGFQGGSSNLVATTGMVASITDDMPKFSRDSGGTLSIEMYQVDIHSGPGDSGAPVLRQGDGAIVGLLIESNGTGIANVIPSGAVLTFLSQNGIHLRQVAAKPRPKTRAGKM